MTSVYPKKPDGSSSGPGKRVNPNRPVVSQKDFEDSLKEEQIDELSKNFLMRASDKAERKGRELAFKAPKTSDRKSRQANDFYNAATSGNRYGPKGSGAMITRTMRKKDRHDDMEKYSPKNIKEEEQDSRNPLPPSGAKERIQNKLGTGAKSSVDPSYKHQGPSASDREEMNKKMEKLDEVLEKAKDKMKYLEKAAGQVQDYDPYKDRSGKGAKKVEKRVKGVQMLDRKIKNKGMGSMDEAHEEIELEEKASPKQQEKVAKIMGEFKRGKLHSGSKKGPEVTSRKQAVAIAMNQAGLSKDKMNEDFDLDAVMEEIARNLGEDAFNELIKNKD